MEKKKYCQQHRVLSNENKMQSQTPGGISIVLNNSSGTYFFLHIAQRTVLLIRVNMIEFFFFAVGYWLTS